MVFIVKFDLFSTLHEGSGQSCCHGIILTALFQIYWFCGSQGRTKQRLIFMVGVPLCEGLGDENNNENHCLESSGGYNKPKVDHNVNTLSLNDYPPNIVTPWGRWRNSNHAAPVTWHDCKWCLMPQGGLWWHFCWCKGGWMMMEKDWWCTIEIGRWTRLCGCLRLWHCFWGWCPRGWEWIW